VTGIVEAPSKQLQQSVILIAACALTVGAASRAQGEPHYVLALMGTNRGFFNRLCYRSFRSKAVSSVLYPILRACRDLLLKLLGKTKINNLKVAGNDCF
jgi:hypothetical protein